MDATQWLFSLFETNTDNFLRDLNTWNLFLATWQKSGHAFDKKIQVAFKELMDKINTFDAEVATARKKDALASAEARRLQSQFEALSNQHRDCAYAFFHEAGRYVSGTGISFNVQKGR